jgi:hypothetical protein
MDNPILSDFRNFVYLTWKEGLSLPEPSELQYNIALELQSGWQPSADGITRIQIQAARGFAKTYILCAWCVWLLLRDPDKKILFISMNTNRAKEAVRLMRQIINSLPVCAHLVPKEDYRDNADRFDVGAVTRPAKDPSIAAYGVGSAVAGTHPDVIVADDTETKENSLSATNRERLLAAYFEFESMIQPGGTIVHMGTPQSGDSCYNTLAKDYRLKRWPCRFPRLDDPKACKNIATWMLDKVRDNPLLAGEPSYPERFGEEALQEKLAILGPYHFALQMMLDTGLADSDRYPLKCRNLIVMSCSDKQAPANVVWGTANKLKDIRCPGLADDAFYGPAYTEATYLPYQKGIMFVDPAGGGGDKTAYAVLKGLKGIVYLLDAGGLVGGHSDVVLEKLAKVAHRWGVKRVLVETNFGDGLYEKALAGPMGRINGPTQIESVRSKGQKERRICDTLEPVICSHRLVMDTEVAANKELILQLTHITRDRGCLKEDDLVDALAGGIADFVDFVGIDPGKAEEARKESERQQLVKGWSKAGRDGAGRQGMPDKAGYGMPARMLRRSPWDGRRKNTGRAR